MLLIIICKRDKFIFQKSKLRTPYKLLARKSYWHLSAATIHQCTGELQYFLARHGYLHDICILPQDVAIYYDIVILHELKI